MANTFQFECNLTDRNGNPMIGVEVEALDINLFTNAAPDPMHYIVALATTDISGTARFSTLPVGSYFARPRITHREDMRIQVTKPSGMGGGGKLCYAALVSPIAGIGTHTTIQSAITTLGITGGVIFICGGTYTEALTIAGDTEGLWLVGAARDSCILVGVGARTITVNAAGSGPVNGLRIEHLTIDGNAGTAIWFDSVPGGQPVNVTLTDLYIKNAAVGIDMSDLNGGADWLIDNVDMPTTVAAAGSFEVTRLNLTNCRWLCSGTGPYFGGGSAIADLKVSNSTFWGGGTYVVEIRNVITALVSGCHIVGTGAGTSGIYLVSTLTNLEITSCIIIMAAGVAIDASTALGITGLTISDVQASCAIPQTPDRIGFDLTPAGLTELVISGCRIKNFESYGIRLGATDNYNISDTVIINGGDCHSIYLAGTADYGTITGCMLQGTGGVGVTYGIYGAAGVTYTVIVGNLSRLHDDITNLVDGVDGNVVAGNSPVGGGGAIFHQPVTLDAGAAALLDISALQVLSLDLQFDNQVFAGPVVGVPATPAFRALDDLDIPAAILRDAEHTAIGDGAPHHPAVTLGVGSDPALALAGQQLTLADVLTPAEHTAIGDGAPHHPAVTLDIDTAAVFGIAAQVLSFDTQPHGFVLIGPVAGVPAVPTFRALDVADLPVEAIVDADFVAAEGFMRKTGAGTYIAHKSNLAAAVDPGVDDDVTLGYSVGSVWINTTLDTVWQCVDATDGVAVWRNLSSTDHARLHGLGDVADHSHLADYTVSLGLANLKIDDANFEFNLEAGGPAITFDAGLDFLGYVRAGNYFNFAIGGTEYLRIGTTGALVDDILELTGAHGVEIEGVKALDSFLEFTEIATPGNPAANQARLYAHDVGGVTKPMWLDAAGTETDLTAAGGGGAHDLLSATHTDTTPAACVLGDLITGQAGPIWARLGIGAGGTVLTSVAGIPAWVAPSGGTRIIDADADTKVDVEEAADEDRVRMDVAGTERFVLQNVSPHLLLTGDARVNGHLGVRADPVAYAGICYSESLAWAGILYGAQILPTNTDIGGNASCYGIAGTATVNTAAAKQGCRGLSFFAIQAGAGVLSALQGAYAGVQTNANAGEVTVVQGLFLYAGLSTTCPVTTSTGIHITNFGKSSVTTVYGLRIVDQSGAATNYILELGPATPYLRLVGGAVPGAGLTHLWLYEGTTPALRNVAFADTDATGHLTPGAIKKVLYLV